MCSVSRLISSFCLATVSRNTARLAANSASGHPSASVWFATAAMFSKYPSSEFSIWFDRFCVPSVFLFSCATSAAPNSADPPNGFYSPTLAASTRLLVTYAARKVVLHSAQVCLFSGIFKHSRFSVSYSLDWSRDFSATARRYSSLMTSFARLGFFCAASIALINCGIPSLSLNSFFMTCGISTASMVCSPEQNSVRC